MHSRRAFMARMSAFAATLAALPRVSHAAAEPFDAGTVARLARQLANAPFQVPDDPLPDAVKSVGYDGYRDIRYRADRAVWANEGLPFRVQFFHRGWLMKNRVQIFVVDGGEAHEVGYDPASFDFGAQTDIAATSGNLGFAGFRVMYPLNRDDVFDELLVFLGASYFRTVGKGLHYGLSARGLAIDTAINGPEEFPVFREFWLETPGATSETLTMHALLDSPSCTGAFTFVVDPGDATVMTVSMQLFARRDINKLGIAPLTSMFLFGENDHDRFADFRPEVHDSDGLLMHSGASEILWRPLVNPRRLRLSSFRDENPKGFGLMQRDRRFESYEDLEARYEQRPSLWVKPIGDWGKGVVHLVEIPTEQEIHDNIVAFWWPEQKLLAGQEMSFSYELHWGNRAPIDRILGRLVQTRVGVIAGKDDARKFVLDYAGPAITALPEGARPELTLHISAGETSKPVVKINPELTGLRAFFDFVPEGSGPIEMRADLIWNGNPIAETWVYQWTA
jgi:periplasmic glucans biosynthesis protein